MKVIIGLVENPSVLYIVCSIIDKLKSKTIDLSDSHYKFSTLKRKRGNLLPSGFDIDDFISEPGPTRKLEDKLLPVKKACDLEDRDPETRWLIESLWTENSVGIIGAEPKSAKSFLGLTLAVAVASGSDCLDRFPVKSPGRVLLYAAEDALSVVKSRLQGICFAAGVNLIDLDIDVITAPTFRLDLVNDVRRLEQTVKTLRPRFLLLDPFVRLHRIDENSAEEVAPLLSHLRELNRLYDLNIALVHHAKKGSKGRPGQALRGSSEFHAWGDCNLYPSCEDKSRFRLKIEHRSERQQDDVLLELYDNERGPALRIVEEESFEADDMTAEGKVNTVLANADSPLTVNEIRKRCKLRKTVVCEAVTELVSQRKIVKTKIGYEISD